MLLSVWRVTRGPNRKLPLAFCYFRTIGESDFEFRDMIHRDSVSEGVNLSLAGIAGCTAKFNQINASF